MARAGVTEIAVCAGRWLIGSKRGFVGLSRTGSVGLLAVALAAAAAPAAEVVESSVKAPGRVREVATGDLDGDGLVDLAALSVTGHASDAVHHLSVYWQRPENTFPEQPDTVWDLDRRIVLLDLSPDDAPAGEPAAIYSLGADGVSMHRFRRRGGAVESTPVLSATLDHLVPGDEWMVVDDFVRDWRGKGREMLIPGFPHPRLFRSGETDWANGTPLEVEPVATYWVRGSDKEVRGAALHAQYTFPVPVSADQNGDGRQEIAFVERNRVTVFETVPVDEGGERLERKVYPLRILTDEEAASDRFNVRPRLIDVNGDDRADLVVVVFRDTGIFQLEGRILVFFCRLHGSFVSQPDQVIEVDNALYNLAHILDLDGSGTLELIIPSAKLGLWGYLRLLTTHKASFAFNTVAHDGESAFDVEGMATDSMTARLSKRYDLPVIKLEDMDGDGFADVLIGTGEDRVCTHVGMPGEDRRFRSKPSSCFKADPYARYVIADLDGNGRMDLIRHNPTGEKPGEITLTQFGD
jgi:hypothetical protein